MSSKYPGGIISKTAPTPSGPYADSTAPGVWTLEQQAYWQKLGQWPTQGNVNPSAFIENLFQTYLYTGNGSTQTITNGIDLSTYGGLVWSKGRSAGAAYNHRLQDTANGVSTYLSSNTTTGNTSQATGVTAFNSNGYTLGSNALANQNNETYVGWTFRKQAKFFDVVTYTGTGSTSLTVNHNLGSTPGCIIIKWTSGTGYGWYVYHRATSGTPQASCLILNSTGAAFDLNGGSNWIVPSSTNFQVSTTDGGANASGQTYVAYLFAHNAGGFGLTGTDNVISCGSFTTDGSGNATVNLGYEAQWVIQKSVSTGGWAMYDIMRGMTTKDAGGDAYLFANLSIAEGTDNVIYPYATGFGVQNQNASETYIYIAIRRGPMKVPTSGTSVFYPNAIAQTDSPDSTNVPFPPDLVNTFSRDGVDRYQSNQFNLIDRLRGLGTPNNTYSSSGLALTSSSTGAESSSFPYVQLKADSQNITRGSGWNSSSYGNWIYYFFRRAPSFFDEVCYTGTGSATTFSHNLGVAPELMIVKSRSSGVYDWRAYSATLGATKYLTPNSTGGEATSSTSWNDTAPTASVFTVGSSAVVNGSGGTYVAYLFATCAGVSKVGSYTGTGTTLQVDCGFTGGARFVLIKRTDSTGDWYVWDSARGIVAGNDPYLLLNSTAAEVTNTDYVDTYSAGFEISSTAPSAINANGGTFIFLAIA